MVLSDSRRSRRPTPTLRSLPSPMTGLPRLPESPFQRAVPTYPGGPKQVRVSVASLSVRPSPNLRRVGVRNFTFEACSGFTHVTARWIAQPPRAAFVARLQPGQLPNQAACQLPDQPTIIWMEPTSIG